MTSYLHDPDADLDYSWVWTDWLDGDTIDSVDVLLTGGATLGTVTHDDTTVTAWISGATGRQVQATCRITTAAGRVDDRTIVLRITER